MMMMMIDDDGGVGDGDCRDDHRNDVDDGYI